MAKKNVFQYPGEKATVSWNNGLCIHIGECGYSKGCGDMKSKTVITGIDQFSVIVNIRHKGAARNISYQHFIAIIEVMPDQIVNSGFA